MAERDCSSFVKCDCGIFFATLQAAKQHKCIKDMADETAKKLKSPDWPEPAVITFNALVRDSWDLLFGEYKGTGADKVSVVRRRIWDTIAQRISVEFGVHRTWEQCRKKYQNAKTRYVHKVGQLRHPPTGGGSAPTLTSAEEIIAATMEGHPVVEGIVGGIDSDVQVVPSELATSLTGINAESRRTEVENDGKEHGEKEGRTEPVERGLKRKESFSKKSDKRRTITESSIDCLTSEDLRVDIKKINIEIEKLNHEIEKIILEKQLVKLKIKNEENYAIYLQSKTMYYNAKVLGNL
ncbi:uncharacterized protein LOC127860484 isoform X2 [Dreissena polymorpha]|uniref:uncharacterized protein LOC127860484 isoform X2 n=1 Tax=Dreissena polymorpha TaxID=45954 RepID=UPI00226550BA|nr:uncharacterized protein LOC127860484 isoform X2 [Dreissena polymorpha]